MDATNHQALRPINQELVAYLDARFRQITNLQEETRRDVASLGEEASRRFEQVESHLQELRETDCQTLAVIEGLRHELRLFAEGLVVLDDRLRCFHRETSLAFDQVKGEIEPYYKNLSSRLAIVESWADRQHTDVMDAVRKLLGHPPLSLPVSSE